MYLTASNIAHYLIHRGLVKVESVVDGDLAVREAGRRNRNFKVSCRTGSGLFVKQMSANTADSVVPLQREAAFYGLVQKRVSFQRLSGHIPKLIDFDPAVCALAVDLVDGGENLTEYFLRVRVFPAHVGESLGITLAECHETVSELTGEVIDFSVLPRRLPWILSLEANTLKPLSQLGSVGVQLAEILNRSPVILQGLNAVRSEWRFDSLIHGDIKWDNCLIFPGKSGRPEVRIVDWELVDFGDGCWDVASVFASYFIYWALTLGSHANPGTAGNGAIPDMLVAMRPSLQKFFHAYCKQRGLSGSGLDLYRDKCIRYCAARMVLSVFEFSQGTTQLSPTALFAIQLIQNINLDPRRAAWDLVGL